MYTVYKSLLKLLSASTSCLTFYIAYVLGQIQHEAAIPQLIEVLYVKTVTVTVS